MHLADADGYTVERETYRLTDPRLDRLQQRMQTEVGDRDSDVFRPVLDIRRWNGRAGLRLRLPNIEGATEELSVENDREIVWRAGLYEARFYGLDAGHRLIQDADQMGGFEFEVRLNRRPPTNIVPLIVSRRGVKLIYQGTLQADSDAQVAAGGLALDLDSLERPVNVLHSYSVVSTSLVGNRFRTGKLCHLYRPEAIDALGARTWCRFGDDAEATGVLRIIVPPAFLANATYPVTIDPSFGYSSSGASTLALDNGTNNTHMVGCSGGAGTDDSTGAVSGDQIITGMHAYCSVVADTGTNECRMGVYIDPGQTTSSSHTLTGSESSLVVIDTTGATQYDFDATPTLSDGVAYVVAITGQNTTSFRVRVHYDTGGFKDSHRDTNETGVTLQADLSGFGVNGTQRASTWADYAAVGGARRRITTVHH